MSAFAPNRLPSYTLPWPGSVALNYLDERTSAYRFVVQPFVYHDAYKGVGTFEAFCPQRILRSWANDALPARAQTAVRAAWGGVCQVTVWLFVGVYAGLAAAAIRATQGQFACDVFMSKHYVPLMVATVSLSSAAYMLTLLGCACVFNAALRNAF